MKRVSRIVRTIFLVSTVISISQIPFTTNEIFAVSPSFPRQEIIDDSHDWFLSPNQRDREMYSKVQEQNITACKIDDPLYSSPDISSVGYYSDGNSLNSTIWLSSPLVPPTNESVSFLYAVFTIQIDVQSTFDEKLDYVVHFLWNNTSGEWSKAVSEQSSDGRPRVLNVKGNYTGSDHLGQNGYLALSADLDTLHFPSQYNVLFTVDNIYLLDGTLCHVADVTNWIPIPPPQYSMIITPSHVGLRPGEEKNVEMKIISNSLANLEAVAAVSSRISSTSGLNIRIDPNIVAVPPSSFATADLYVGASETARPKGSTLPVSANISFLTSAENVQTGVKGPESQGLQQITKESNLTVNVLQPLTSNEQVRTFLDDWVNPLTGAITAISAAATGVLGWLLGLRRQYTKSREVK